MAVTVRLLTKVGAVCCIAAAIQRRTTISDTVAAASRSASAGNHSKTSLPIWASVQQAQVLIALTAAKDMNQVTAAGQLRISKQITLAPYICLPTMGPRNPFPNGHGL